METPQIKCCVVSGWKANVLWEDVVVLLINAVKILQQHSYEERLVREKGLTD